MLSGIQLCTMPQVSRTETIDLVSLSNNLDSNLAELISFNGNEAAQSCLDSEESPSDESNHSNLCQNSRSPQAGQTNIQFNPSAQDNLESLHNEPEDTIDLPDQGILGSLQVGPDSDGRDEIHDCSSFFSQRLSHTHPTILYSPLVAALCHILNHVSANVSSHILKSQIQDHPVGWCTSPTITLSMSQNYEMCLSPRIADTEEPQIIFHENEILCHCAWIKYNTGELSTEINFETLALVVLDRS
ncbi:hypothetical protein PSHT_15351 [Puccinia striiformis]|uniref:Uncharacterized protein n=1 Tax=Puccinia striiformis TaxID=27350 RepID=A0A2S4UFP1_9BASI|nr:hypothetical protein PSHT_15351 [Puccinia striiformis]